MNNSLQLDADRSDVAVYPITLPGIKAVSVEMGGKCFIGINQRKLRTTAEENVAFAHELGHCKLGQFYTGSSSREIISRAEERADRWSIKRLVPFAELQSEMQINPEKWSLAEHFNVTEDFIEKAVEYYKITGLLKEEYI